MGRFNQHRHRPRRQRHHKYPYPQHPQHPQHSQLTHSQSMDSSFPLNSSLDAADFYGLPVNKHSESKPLQRSESLNGAQSILSTLSALNEYDNNERHRPYHANLRQHQNNKYHHKINKNNNKYNKYNHHNKHHLRTPSPSNITNNKYHWNETPPSLKRIASNSSNSSHSTMDHTNSPRIGSLEHFKIPKKHKNINKNKKKLKTLNGSHKNNKFKPRDRDNSPSSTYSKSSKSSKLSLSIKSNRSRSNKEKEKETRSNSGTPSLIKNRSNHKKNNKKNDKSSSSKKR